MSQRRAQRVDHHNFPFGKFFRKFFRRYAETAVRTGKPRRKGAHKHVVAGLHIRQQMRFRLLGGYLISRRHFSRRQSFVKRVRVDGLSVLALVVHVVHHKTEANPLDAVLLVIFKRHFARRIRRNNKFRFTHNSYLRKVFSVAVACFTASPRGMYYHYTIFPERCQELLNASDESRILKKTAAKNGAIGNKY